MADWDDVRHIALALPGTEESVSSRGWQTWSVRNKLFAWERPLLRSDLEALGPDAPEGPVLGVRVADLGVKEALLADPATPCFTTPHFDGYPAVLVRLGEVRQAELEELVVEAWRCRAGKRQIQEHDRSTT